MNIVMETGYPMPLAASPLLPLLLLSLTRQKHSPDTATQISEEYDYVIVGAGSAGSVLASRLSEVSCVSVLLLEAGKKPPLLTEVPMFVNDFLFTDVDWQHRTVPQRYAGKGLENREFPLPTGKMLGGTSVLNALFAYRGNRADYDNWAANGAQGWSYDNVLPYFLKLEDYRDPEYLTNGYHAVNGPLTIENMRDQPEAEAGFLKAAEMLGYKIVDTNGRQQTGFSRLKPNTRDGQTCSTAKAYLVPADKRKNLDILPNAMVTKILMDHHHATGVQFDHHGIMYKVRAKREVIVSAGTFETPKLLMLSGIGPRHELEELKIPVVADLPVGLNLQDHVAAIVNFADLNKKSIKIEEKLEDPIHTVQYIGNRTGLLTRPYGCYAMGNFKQQQQHHHHHHAHPQHKEDIPDYQLTMCEFSKASLQSSIGLDLQVFEEIFEDYQEKPYHACLAAVLHPKSRGTVRLRSTDPYDSPIIDPKYFERSEDLDTAVQAMKTCLRLVETPPMQKLGFQELQTVIPGCESFLNDEDNYLRCSAKSIAMSIYHYVGTAKMGDPEDHSTVLDPELRVKSVKGLRVVDASVMPTIPSANTNVPTIMIAEKAADLIKATITCGHSAKCQEGVPVEKMHLGEHSKWHAPSLLK